LRGTGALLCPSAAQDTQYDKGHQSNPGPLQKCQCFATMEKRRSGRSARRVSAENVRKLRRERGLSQESLAEQSQLHRTYVGSVERGERNVSIDSMERLATALGVELREML
jgi:ribosome-binding protein aMBF1 (putative translation factor)